MYEQTRAINVRTAVHIDFYSSFMGNSDIWTVQTDINCVYLTPKPIAQDVKAARGQGLSISTAQPISAEGLDRSLPFLHAAMRFLALSVLTSDSSDWDW